MKAAKDPAHHLKLLNACERLHKVLSGIKGWKEPQLSPEDCTPVRIFSHLLQAWQAYSKDRAEYLVFGNPWKDQESIREVVDFDKPIMAILYTPEDPVECQPEMHFLPELEGRDPRMFEMIMTALALLWSKSVPMWETYTNYVLDICTDKAHHIRHTLEQAKKAKKFPVVNDYDDDEYTIQDADTLECAVKEFEDDMIKNWLVGRIIPRVGRRAGKRKEAIKDLQKRMKRYNFNTTLKRLTRDWLQDVVALTSLTDAEFNFRDLSWYCPMDSDLADDPVLPDQQMFFRWGAYADSNPVEEIMSDHLNNERNNGSQFTYRIVWHEKEKGNPFEIARTRRVKEINEIFVMAERIFNCPKGGYVKNLNSKTIKWR